MVPPSSDVVVPSKEKARIGPVVADATAQRMRSRTAYIVDGAMAVGRGEGTVGD